MSFDRRVSSQNTDSASMAIGDNPTADNPTGCLNGRCVIAAFGGAFIGAAIAIFVLSYIKQDVGSMLNGSADMYGYIAAGAGGGAFVFVLGNRVFSKCQPTPMSTRLNAMANGEEEQDSEEEPVNFDPITPSLSPQAAKIKQEVGARLLQQQQSSSERPQSRASEDDATQSSEVINVAEELAASSRHLANLTQLHLKPRSPSPPISPPQQPRSSSQPVTPQNQQSPPQAQSQTVSTQKYVSHQSIYTPAFFFAGDNI